MDIDDRNLTPSNAGEHTTSSLNNPTEFLVILFLYGKI